MTANTPGQHPHVAAVQTAGPPGEPYSVRLATWIPQPLDQRLRVLAALSGKPITHVLAELLARGLPTADELAAQLQRKGSTDEH